MLANCWCWHWLCHCATQLDCTHALFIDLYLWWCLAPGKGHPSSRASLINITAAAAVEFPLKAGLNFVPLSVSQSERQKMLCHTCPFIHLSLHFSAQCAPSNGWQNKLQWVSSFPPCCLFSATPAPEEVHFFCLFVYFAVLHQQKEGENIILSLFPRAHWCAHRHHSNWECLFLFPLVALLSLSFRSRWLTFFARSACYLLLPKRIHSKPPSPLFH